MITCTSTDETAEVEKANFIMALRSTIIPVPVWEQVVFSIEADARTGKREEEGWGE